MATSTFSIPDELSNQLRYVSALDNRPFEEILQSLDKYQSVVSEKNIWAFWDSGLRSMPRWCQRNVIDWVRLNGNDWTVRILDHVEGSPNNVLKYVSKETLPSAYLKDEMTGPYVGQHSADLVRGACLVTHGGVWLDVGIILFRKLDTICWQKLEDPLAPFAVSVMHMGGTGMSNHFIAARKGSPFIKHWHELFTYLWKDRTTCGGLSGHPLLALVLAGGKFYDDEETSYRFGWEHKAKGEHIMDYGAQVLAWQRIAMTENTGDGFNGPEYFATKVLLLNVIEESWRAESLIGWRGSQLFNILSTKLDTSAKSQKYQAAFKTVWTILAQASMQKVYHGKELLKYPALGELWDAAENENDEFEAGTFAELLRYGSVHFEQRRGIAYVQNPRPSATFRKGLYEA
ncbi:related to capsule polysaccharide biosynthesis protein [Phialocephala subalpina]|uniref:Related to capsule polysaccharide biosynthesis protein n=1 Tax=Phialocephala subalpina TaxID=576137 RepID=A0A1L7WLS3_9HELO|nr:related to capsule polysaccharide biosynthesis protein [Phialocephala subalpina]